MKISMYKIILGAFLACASMNFLDAASAATPKGQIYKYYYWHNLFKGNIVTATLKTVVYYFTYNDKKDTYLGVQEGGYNFYTGTDDYSKKLTTEDAKALFEAVKAQLARDPAGKENDPAYYVYYCKDMQGGNVGYFDKCGPDILAYFKAMEISADKDQIRDTVEDMVETFGGSKLSDLQSNDYPSLSATVDYLYKGLQSAEPSVVRDHAKPMSLLDQIVEKKKLAPATINEAKKIIEDSKVVSSANEIFKSLQDRCKDLDKGKQDTRYMIKQVRLEVAYYKNAVNAGFSLSDRSRVRNIVIDQLLQASKIDGLDFVSEEAASADLPGGAAAGAGGNSLSLKAASADLPGGAAAGAGGNSLSLKAELADSPGGAAAGAGGAASEIPVQVEPPLVSAMEKLKVQVNNNVQIKGQDPDRLLTTPAQRQLLLGCINQCLFSETEFDALRDHLVNQVLAFEDQKKFRDKLNGIKYSVITVAAGGAASTAVKEPVVVEGAGLHHVETKYAERVQQLLQMQIVGGVAKPEFTSSKLGFGKLWLQGNNVSFQSTDLIKSQALDKKVKELVAFLHTRIGVISAGLGKKYYPIAGIALDTTFTARIAKLTLAIEGGSRYEGTREIKVSASDLFPCPAQYLRLAFAELYPDNDHAHVRLYPLESVDIDTRNGTVQDLWQAIIAIPNIACELNSVPQAAVVETPKPVVPKPGTSAPALSDGIEQGDVNRAMQLLDEGKDAKDILRKQGVDAGKLNKIIERAQAAKNAKDALAAGGAGGVVAPAVLPNLPAPAPKAPVLPNLPAPAPKAPVLPNLPVVKPAVAKDPVIKLLEEANAFANQLVAL